MLCGSSLWKSLKPWVSQPFARYREAAMRQQVPDADQALGNAVCAAPGRLALRGRNWLAYTGSSAVPMQTSFGSSAPPGQPSNALLTNKPRRRSRIDLFGKAGRKQAWPSARAPHRAPTLHLVARACTCNGAPERAPRAPPRHTSIYCIEGAAPQSSTGNDGLQLVEGR